MCLLKKIFSGNGLPFSERGINVFDKQIHSAIMKKLACLSLAAGLIFTGCADNGVVNEKKVDKLGRKFDSAAEKLWDSTKVKGREVGKDIKERIDSLKNK